MMSFTNDPATAEGRADDHADGQVERIPLDDEVLELLQHPDLPVPSAFQATNKS